jgi:hypothetical protein
MISLWIVVYSIAVGLAVLQAFLVGMQTFEHRRFARSRLRDVIWCRARGRAVLFVPCRGGDVGLERNLHNLFLQDYDDYEIHFILEGPGDPVWPIIRRVSNRHPRIATRIVFAGQAAASGQKVHNLRVATSELDPGVEYLAFVDADARPSTGWLRAMLGRLDLPGVGAVSGYRWFVPQKDSLANLVLYSVNCGLTALLGKRGPNQVWGGSWAIRRATFDEVGLSQAWKGTLSDDLVASRVIREAGYRVEFEPAAVVQSPLDYSFRDMFSFLRRQYIIGRVYAPGLWAFGLAMTTYANLLLFGSLAAAVWGLAVRSTAGPFWWAPAAAFALLYSAHVFRAAVRQDAAIAYFPELEDALRLARRWDVWAAPLFGLVNWLGLVAASVGRHITWRGITYRLYRGGQVRMIHREDGLRLVGAEEVEEALPSIRYRKAG